MYTLVIQLCVFNDKLGKKNQFSSTSTSVLPVYACWEEGGEGCLFKRGPYFKFWQMGRALYYLSLKGGTYNFEGRC